ncbi:nuclear receptor subfamily 2 group C member 2 isoform X3 [Scyliorhinus torazame]|uniref:nuclear receptor subfamily 2 group C member 2 isoform X3 n=1 Tax=Scyliorhinus torazame TaxID=75743 RepID=UPI003B5932A3
MTSPPQKIQIISTESPVSSPQRIQIVTDQQTGQKIQIVTTLDTAASSKELILATPDGRGAGRVILDSGNNTAQGKLVLTTPESLSSKQLILTTTDGIVPQRFQIVTDAAAVERLLIKTEVQRSQPIEYCVVCGDKASAVQCERKPIEAQREKPANCAASTEKIYIRKDLRSPLTAMPTFIAGKESVSKVMEGVINSALKQHLLSNNLLTDAQFVFRQDHSARYSFGSYIDKRAECQRQTNLFESGALVNIQQPLIQTDSGAVLVAADCKAETSQGDLGTLANVVSSLANLSKGKDNSQSLSDLTAIEALNNGDISVTDLQQEDQSTNEITRAFDTLAKALSPTDGSSVPILMEGLEVLGGPSIQLMSRDQSMPIIEVEGPLLTDTHVIFKLTMPTPMPEYLNVHYICESASRLLFLSMHWARSIPAFQALGQDCNTSLVRACWNELFTLALAQCSQVMNLSTILTAIVNHLQSSLQQGYPSVEPNSPDGVVASLEEPSERKQQEGRSGAVTDKLSADRVKVVMEHIWKLQEFCNNMTRLGIDRFEYAYLKAIVLFSPDHPGLSNMSQIGKFQDKAQMELQDYVQKTYPEDSYRLARILLRLPALRLMNSSITEELFFTGLIGNVQIDSIIPYILRMETAEYNSQIIGSSA